MALDINQRNADIYARFIRERPAARTDKEACEWIADDYALSAKRIGVIVRKQRPKPEPPPDLDPLVDALKRENDLLRAEIRILKNPTEAATPLRGDSDRLKDMYADLRELPRYARVHVVSDEHIDDHDARAITMNCLISQYVKPDVLVFNGDQFDFSALSLHYQVDRADSARDAFRSVRPYYQDYVDRSTGRFKIFLDGNHNARLDAFVKMQASQFSETLEDEYAALVRYNNKVIWLGGLEEIDIGGLHVHHGTRTGMNAAKNALQQDFGSGVTVVQGHTHGVNSFVQSVKIPGEDRFRVVTSVNAGFAGRKPPHYQKRRTNLSKWIYASTVFHVNMHGDDIHAQTVIYHETPQGGLVAFYGSKMFRVNAAGEDEAPQKIVPFGEIEDEDNADLGLSA